MNTANPNPKRLVEVPHFVDELYQAMTAANAEGAITS
jgi:hypothetical protein